MKTLVTGAGLFLVVLLNVYIILQLRQENRQLTMAVRQAAPGKFTRLTHGVVHYIYKGNPSGPLIVFVHGGGVTGWEVWKKNIPFFLDQGYHILTMDLYGRGYSDRPKIANSASIFTEQLTDLLRKLKVTRPFHLVSMSMGAAIAMDYIEMNPGRVLSLILIDPATTGDYQPNPLLNVSLVSDFLMAAVWYPRAIENQRKEFFDGDQFDEYARRLKYFMDFEGYKFTNHSTWFNILSHNQLQDFDAPTGMKVMLIYGDCDPYFNDNLAKIYSESIPQLQILKIKNTGHMPHYEKPIEINQAMGSFLAGSSER